MSVNICKNQDNVEIKNIEDLTSISGIENGDYFIVYDVSNDVIRKIKKGNITLDMALHGDNGHTVSYLKSVNNLSDAQDTEQVKNNLGLGDVPNVDATKPENWDRAGATINQFIIFNGSKWAPVNLNVVQSWTIITTNINAQLRSGYLVDTSVSQITLTLPSSPPTGHPIGIKDFKGNAYTRNIILDPNGENFEGSSENFIIQSDKQGMEIVFSDSDTGWVRVNETYGPATYS